MTLLLLVFTSGVSVQLSYCKGELMSVSVNDVEYTTRAADALPPCCKGEKSKDCAMGHMQHFVLKVCDQYRQGQSVLVSVLPSQGNWLPQSLPALYSFPLHHPRLIAAANEDPPDYRDSLYRGPSLVAPHGVRGSPLC